LKLFDNFKIAFFPHILRKHPWKKSEEHLCLRAALELIKAGADLTAVNNEGKTPMETNYYVQQLRQQKPELFR
jgi:hypothetical protein